MVESKQMNIHNRLKEGHTYVLEIPYDKFTKYQGNRYTAFGKGIYKGTFHSGSYHYYLWDVTVYLRGTNIIFDRNDVNELGVLLLHQRNTFYDLEEIKNNAKRARQQMEQRALNKILKGLVNEHFQW